MGKRMDKHHAALLKTFHTLCSELGMSQDEKLALINQFNTEHNPDFSSADLDTHDLLNICGTLETNLNKQKGHNLDLLRKRLIAAIGGFLTLTNQQHDIALIKGIACRATGYQSFNKIPAERLRNLYSAFVKKQKDFKAVDAFANTHLGYMQSTSTDKTIN